MYTVFHIYSENIRYYFTKLIVIQKLKSTNKVGVTSGQVFFLKIKSAQQHRQLK